MTHMVQARVTDAQFEWLASRAYALHDGDLSKSLRDAIGLAESLEEMLRADDPHAELQDALDNYGEEPELYVDPDEEETPDEA